MPRNKPDDTGATRPEDMPPAGPSAKPENVDKEKTPGSGLLPEPTPDGEVDPGGG